MLGRLETPRTFLYGTAILVPCLLLWASVAEIDRVVRVEGVVIPVGRSQKIQHLEGGIIQSITAREGANVKKGDLLLTIDNTSAGASLSETKVKLDSQEAHIIRLRAEVEEKGTLEFPEYLKGTAVAAAETELFLARRKNLEKMVGVHESMIRQSEAEIREAKERSLRLRSELETANERVAMMERMAKGNAASKLEVLDAKSRQQRLKTEISEVLGSVPKLEANIAEERSRIDAAHSDFKAQAQDELVKALAESERLKQTVSTAEDRLKRTEIRSPINGVVNHIAVNTVGGVVRPGDNLLELIPETNEVLIEAKAHPRDRGFLRPDLPAQVRISAYDVAEYGVLEGHVVEVGADALEGKRDDSYYEVDVRVNSLPANYEGKSIIPGMTATADIVTGRRTVLSYLLSPFRKFQYNMFRDPR